MNKNYHFHLHPDEPSEERIQQFRDFDALLSAHRQRVNKEPVRRMPALRIVFAVAAAMAAGLALLFFLRTGSESAAPSPDLLARESVAFFAERPALQAPLPGISVPEQRVVVASATGAEVDLSDQARMRIPATAFIDADGQQVTGEVQITYRTLADQADLLVSGLPMEYEQGAQRLQLSSAGVVEVRASQNGEQVRLAPDKTLELTLVEPVALSPGVSVAQREILYWEAAQNRWTADQAQSYAMVTASKASQELSLEQPEEYRAAKVALQDSLAREKQQLVAELSIPEPPVAPEGGSSDRPTFELDLDNDSAIQLVGVLADRPETVTEQKAWVVSEKSADFDLRALTVVWETITVEAINDGEYRMTFRAGESSDAVIVKPLLSPEAYAAAMDTYRSELAAWTALRDRLEDERTARLAELNDRYAAREAALEARFRHSLGDADSARIQSAVRTEVVHTFRIPRLGIWSCVQPFATDHEVVIAGLTQKNGESINHKVAYLIDRTENTVYRFHAGEQGALLRFREKPESDFVICVPVGKGRLAVAFQPNLNAEQPTVALDEQMSVNSVAQMKAFLTADG